MGYNPTLLANSDFVTHFEPHFALFNITGTQNSIWTLGCTTLFSSQRVPVLYLVEHEFEHCCLEMSIAMSSVLDPCPAMLEAQKDFATSDCLPAL